MNPSIKDWVAGVIITAGAIGLGACGGGGGGDGDDEVPTASAPLSITTAAEAEAVASTVYDDVTGISDVDPTDLLFGAQVSGDGSTDSEAQTVGSLTKEYLELFFSHSGSADAVAGATFEENCSGGGTITITDNGTSGSIEFDQCREDYFDGYDIINGTIAFSDYSETGDIDFCPYTLTTNTSFKNFSVKEYSLTGTLLDTLSMAGGFRTTVSDDCTVESVGMSGSYLEAAYGGEWVRYFDFVLEESTDFSTYELDYNATLDTSSLSGSVQVQTPTPIAGDVFATYPSSGVLVITGANNAKVALTINSSGATDPNAVTLDVDVDPADGVSDAGYPVDMSWIDLESL